MVIREGLYTIFTHYQLLYKSQGVRQEERRIQIKETLNKSEKGSNHKLEVCWSWSSSLQEMRSLWASKVERISCHWGKPNATLALLKGRRCNVQWIQSTEEEEKEEDEEGRGGRRRGGGGGGGGRKVMIERYFYCLMDARMCAWQCFALRSIIWFTWRAFLSIE